MKKIIFASLFAFCLSLNTFAQTEFVKVKAELTEYEEHYAWFTDEDGVHVDYNTPAAIFEIFEPEQYQLRKVVVIFSKETSNSNTELARIVMKEVRKNYDLKTENLWTTLKMPKGLIYSFDIPKNFFAGRKHDIYMGDIKKFRKEEL